MSKHELDCPLSTIDSDVDAKDCVFCPIARSAYQRGREDAARAVLNKLLPEPTPNEWDAGFNVAIYEAAAAARGEGEQA